MQREFSFLRSLGLKETFWCCLHGQKMPRTNVWIEVVLGPATSPINDIRIWHISQAELALKSPSLPHPPHLQFEVVLETPNLSMWHMRFQPLSCKPAALPKMQLDQTKILMQFILKGEKPTKWILSYCFSCNPSGQVCSTGLTHSSSGSHLGHARHAPIQLPSGCTREFMQ